MINSYFNKFFNKFLKTTKSNEKYRISTKNDSDRNNCTHFLVTIVADKNTRTNYTVSNIISIPPRALKDKYNFNLAINTARLSLAAESPNNLARVILFATSNIYHLNPFKYITNIVEHDISLDDIRKATILK